MHHRDIFENSLDAIFLTAPSGEIFAANPAACAMFGRTEEDICAGGRAKIVDIADDRVRARMEELIEERRRVGRARGELTCVRGDGTRFPVEVTSSVFLDANGAERTSLIVRDLTARKRGEDALRIMAEAGVTLNASLDHATTIQNLTRVLVPGLADICVVDLVEGEQLKRLALGSAERLPSAWTTGPLPTNGETGIMRVLRTGEVELVPVVTKEWLEGLTTDQERLAQLRGLGLRSVLQVPVRNAGRILGVLSVCATKADRRPYDAADVPLIQGIADRAGLAIANARLYEAALQARQIRDEALGVISHDLRGPLNGILLNAQAMARQHPSQELTLIGREVRRADSLIADLLATARLDEGKLPLERQVERIEPLLGEVVDLHRLAAEETRIELAADIASPLPPAFFDRRRVMQVLSNLVGNALKFTPEGGRIRLSARSEPTKLLVAVSDTGRGVAPGDQSHLFDRFWQAAHSRRAGAGLGLAIVKGIVEEHGGELGVESELGKGTTFTFSLPLAPPQP